MQSKPALLVLTNATYESGKLVALGYAEDSSTRWRMSPADAGHLYRGGIRFAMPFMGKLYEVKYEARDPHAEPEWFTVGDHGSVKLLDALPDFPPDLDR